MILVLRALGIGDLATAVPALRGLRAAYPGRTLALAAPDWLTPLIDLIGGVDQVLPVDGLGPYRWSIPAPERAVNLHGRGPQSHRLLRRAGPRRLYAFRCPAAGHTDGPRWSADEHEVRRWCRLLHWYGVPADPADLSLRRPAGTAAVAGLTVVHPGSKERRRRWAPERFAAVARELARAGHRVVITGSATERSLAGWVAHRAGLPADAALAGRMELADLAALVAGARLVVSGDTGVAHLATAYETPSVVLFGPVPPAQWGPPPDRPWHRALWLPDPAAAPHPGLAAGPDGPRAGPVAEAAPHPGADGGPDRPHPGLAAIGVGEVLVAAAAALDAAVVSRSVRGRAGPGTGARTR